MCCEGRRGRGKVCHRQRVTTVLKGRKRTGRVVMIRVMSKYLYERWMWGAIDGNCFALPSVEMLTTLVQVKRRLWRRYNIFYDADTIEEVYPENELVEWVWDAFGEKTEPTIKWRDGEMAYEWTNAWCGGQAPKRIRSFEEEVRVQERRQRYREGVFAWSMAPGLQMPEMAQRALRALGEILTPEEEQEFLDKRKRFWERRRTPCKAQHDAGEPKHVRWDAQHKEKTSKLTVRKRTGLMIRRVGGRGLNGRIYSVEVWVRDNSSASLSLLVFFFCCLSSCADARRFFTGAERDQLGVWGRASRCGEQGGGGVEKFVLRGGVEKGKREKKNDMAFGFVFVCRSIC